MLEILKQFARRLLMGKGKGIPTIPPQKAVDDFAKDLLKKFKQNGVPDEAINNVNDVKAIWNQITNREAQILSTNLKDILGPGGLRKTPLPKKSADVIKVDFDPGGKQTFKGTGDAEVKQIFMGDKDFKDLRYSFRQNIIKNDRQFNKNLAKQIINREKQKIY